VGDPGHDFYSVVHFPIYCHFVHSAAAVHFMASPKTIRE
jgi:hypothetical protein